MRFYEKILITLLLLASNIYTYASEEKIEKFFAIEFDKSIPDDIVAKLRIRIEKITSYEKVSDDMGKRSLLLPYDKGQTLLIYKSKSILFDPEYGNSYQCNIMPGTLYIFSKTTTNELGRVWNKFSLKNTYCMDYNRPTAQALVTLAKQHNYEKTVKK